VKTRPGPLVLIALISFTALADSPPFSSADLNAAAALRERALKGTEAWETVASLTTEIGPRPAGSEADRAAVAWALDRLKAAGFANVRTQDVLVPHWVRGSIEVAITEPWPQPLVAVALGGSVGTPDEGIEADVVQVPDLDALKALSRGQVEGRIVFINRRTERTRDGRGYGQAVRGRTEGANAAAQLGARAVVIRSIGTDSARFGHTGSVRYPPDAGRIPGIALTNPDADLLEHQMATGKPVRLSIKLSARELSQVRSANIIGELAGTSASQEVVLLSAHLDSWDLGSGALDDGAGVAIVIEAVRLVREMKLAPRRTLRVVLFANEEFGLSGANAYATLTPEEVARHVIAMEADLGAGPVWRLDSRVADAALPAVHAIANVLKPMGVERGANTSDGGADIGLLRRQGIPVLSLQHDASNYFDHHHTLDDTLDKVDRKALDHTVAAYAVAAYLSANMRGDFGRLPPQPAGTR
jgi:carboxypeptidase Q